MEPQEYKLNADLAREADGSSRINQSGAYTGKITLAYHTNSAKGATGITLHFASDAGQEANSTIYTYGKDGNPIFGTNQLNALMACLKVRGISPKKQSAKIYDYDSQTDVDKDVYQYPDLMNKPIGVVFQAEEYLNMNNQVRRRVNIVRFYDAATKQTASEILAQSPAKKLEAFLAGLKDKTLSNAPAGSAGKSSPTMDDDYDDDIPF